MDVSIRGSRPRALKAGEPARTVKRAVLPAAVFIVVEILLAAETLWVLLLGELDPRSPAAAPLAILLSVALLANLGLVCSAAAAVAADAIRRADRELGGSIAPVGASEPGDAARPPDAEGSADSAQLLAAPPAMPASG
ncbi:hypothetical protein A5696_02865 [Mycobacterium sp. E2699]|uniref:hypothetical protein n=1 Tax=Mycobacterium sp. E2699 TaxID=1834137 RepID=UPI0008010E3E|nr:hypothetical protein [Mycobacterium sp. E2699]OBH05106.1 hypothetical protein A5696_02865 [Mycobacterium sp. E2699]